VAPINALVFGIVLNLLAFTLIASRANLLAAGLTMAATLFYVLVYTMLLKRSTPQNIVIGGAAGAFPPVIGYAAVTGGVDMTALYMFAIVFFWTPPHFWALALRLNGDYGRAHVPMLPQVRGREETGRQMLLYSVVLTAITVLLGVRGFGLIYLVSALLLGGGLVGLSVLTMRDSGTRWARRTFEYSLLYLALVFTAMVADVLVRA
jgi:protoheme IX farnesyltransferase